MSKLHIIIDASFFCNRTVFALNSEIDKNKRSSTKFLTTKSDEVLYVKKLIDDIRNTLRLFNRDRTGSIIWVQDDKSWRKSVDFKDISYKGNRVKDEESPVNWDRFYQINNEFAEVLNKTGIITSRITSAEADDLIYLWSDYLLQKGESSIIITGDGDFKQCVRSTDDGFITLYNPNSAKKSFVLNQDHKDYLQDSIFTPEKTQVDDYGLFDLDEKVPTLHEMFRYLKMLSPIEWIDHQRFMYNKVLIGDKGDNVPSVVTWNASTGTRVYSVTDNKAADIIQDYLNTIGTNEFMDIIDFYNNDEHVELLAKSLLKVINKNHNIEDVTRRIKENIVLMILHKNIIPSSIVEEFNAAASLAPTQTPFISESKINEIRPDWTYVSRSSSYMSDIFS